MRIFSTLPPHRTAPHRFSPRASSLVAVLLLAFSATFQSHAQTSATASSATSTFPQSWNYKLYTQTGVMTLGWITVEQKDGSSSFRMSGPNNSVCVRGTVKAMVEKNGITTVITPVPPVPDCAVRYIVKNDGTGGIRETKVGDAWVPDGLDRDLTPKR